MSWSITEAYAKIDKEKREKAKKFVITLGKQAAKRTARTTGRVVGGTIKRVSKHDRFKPFPKMKGRKREMPHAFEDRLRYTQANKRPRTMQEVLI